jgi:hypothetical protein
MLNVVIFFQVIMDMAIWDKNGFTSEQITFFFVI